MAIDREKKGRPGLFERITRARRWLWATWADEAPLVYRRTAQGGIRARILWVKAFLFWREVLRQFWRVHGTVRATSLAYTTLLSLIPLLVALSQVLRAYFAQVFPDASSQTATILNLILPYRSPQIIGQLNRFAENAAAVSTLGSILFLIISFRLFMAVEFTVNQIWRVEAARGYRQKLRAFTMLFFWGPVVMGLSFTTSNMLLKNPYVGWVIGSPFAQVIVTFVVFFLAFTMLFWLVPATRVQITSAAIGAFVTTVLFEAVRYGFGLYAQRLFTGNLNLIYGTLGLVVIFLIALEVLWVVILVGVEISYVHQSFQGILRASERQLEEDPRFDVYFALRALAEITRRYQAREEAPSSYRLAEQFGATDPQMLAVLRKLEDAQLVKEIGGDWTGFVPGFDPDVISVDEVIRHMEGGHRDIPEGHVDEIGRRVIQGLFRSLDDCAEAALQNRSVAELVREIYEAPSGTA